MKKQIIALLFVIPTIVLGCQVVLINDGPYSVVKVKDRNAPETPFRVVKKGQKVNANFDPHKHARLLINMNGEFYTVNQHACSKGHGINITTANIKKNNSGKLLTITKGVQPESKQ